MNAWRYLLFPFAALYGFIVWIRNKCFDWGVFSSQSFSIPLIGIGNLSIGGTGKSVVVDFLLQHFQSRYKLATLSRGYGRKTQGYKRAVTRDTALTLGDEPYQFYQKHPDITVAVAEKRVAGVQRLQSENLDIQAILLDDVFQHRWISPTFNILTTIYQTPYIQDWLLPVGNLREPRSGSRRADVILITKTPLNSTPYQREQKIKSLYLAANQSAYCCSIAYAQVVKNENVAVPWKAFKKSPFHLVTGIANAAPLVNYLKEENTCFTHQSFADHFNYTKGAIHRIMEQANGRPILTTEKDFGRLRPNLPQHIELYFLPIELDFFDSEAKSSFLGQLDKILASKN